MNSELNEFVTIVMENMEYRNGIRFWDWTYSLAIALVALTSLVFLL